MSETDSTYSDYAECKTCGKILRVRVKHIHKCMKAVRVFRKQSVMSHRQQEFMAKYIAHGEKEYNK